MTDRENRPTTPADPVPQRKRGVSAVSSDTQTSFLSRVLALFGYKWRLPLALDLVLLFVFTLGIWGAMALLQPEGTLHAYVRRSLNNPSMLLLNALPPALIMTGLYLATGRSLLSGLITGFLFVTMGIVNLMKIAERQEPFLPTDFRLIREAMTVVGQYDVGGLIAILALLMAVVFLGILTIRFFHRAKLRPALRLIGPLLSISLLVGLIFTVYADRERYDSYHDVFGGRLPTYSANGFVYSFFHDITALAVQRPDPADVAAFTALEEEAAGEALPAARPNIVMIMSEAFNEVTESEHLDFTNHRDPLEQFKRIAGESVLYGHFITDVIGGGTVFTEFAALTGISPLTLSAYISPYDFVQNNTDSIAWILAGLGYEAVAVHPYYSWFYNRYNVFPRFGFSTFLHTENHFENATLKGGFISEEDTFDALIEIIDARGPEDKPLFLFCTTIQNHGGYWGKYFTERMYLFDSDLDFEPGELLILDNFIYGLFDLDEQLARLVARLEEDPEPYILVYFGDHAPSLTQSVYMRMGWGNVYGPAIDALEAFTVPFIIWQNQAARQEMDLEARASYLGLLDEPMEVSLFYLAPLLLKLLDFDSHSPFFSFVNAMREEILVMRTGVFRLPGGEFTAEMPESIRELFEKYRSWSHYKVFVQEME